MNLGEGLLFELENGKPKLIFLNHEEKFQKNPVKPRPRLPSVLSCRQPSRLATRKEEQPIRKQNLLNGRSHQNKPGRGEAIVRGWGQTVTTAKTQENTALGKQVKTNAKVKAAKPQNVTPDRKPEEPKKKVGLKVAPYRQSTSLQENEACLTNEQLQHILNVVQTNNYPPNTEENQAECVPESIASETKGPEEIREKNEIETETGNAPNKDKRSRGLLSWVEERPSEDRAVLDAKKAQWKKELDEQLALKQKIQRLAPLRLQGEDDTESLVSVQSSISYKDLPAAIRSSLRVGEFAPMDEVELTQEQRQEQRRLWLQELDKQRAESSERKRLEKLQQQQTEDLHLWACHFDSFHRPPLAPPPCSHAPPPCTLPPPPCPSADRGEMDRCSSLSQWEEVNVRANVETNSRGGHTNSASHLRTMTSLLDPAEIEERECRRLKQLEQQQAIELQVEERRRRREEEESQRKREEEEEERRVEQERERLQRQYEKERQRERNKEQSPEMGPLVTNSSEPEVQSNTANQDTSPEQEAELTAVNHHRDTAVQTEEVHISESLDSGSCGLVSGPVPGLVPGPISGPVSGLNAVVQAQVQQMLHRDFGAEAYEPFTRTERPKKYEKRPEWNTQRPNRKFVPASQRYPEELQRQRQESRLRRQAQLLSLQRNPTSNPHNNNATSRNPANSQNVPPSLSPTEQSGPKETRQTSRFKMVGQPTDKGRSPLHIDSPAPDFLPYVRTDEVFNLRPVETQHQHSLHTAPALRLLQKTQRKEEILRGLAQLRQGLLQKQRELELDLSRSMFDGKLPM
ncbi:coiled-coil domain-containing protein 66 isoform X2 [Boleophthalmus pectinirostris]|uniref:coiled-coil domain-containing protein 66 isoform X2 n=1 Tax=Boleophthalmus pectinirostris TaxID=150288 RepID=UPI00242F3DB6|nr:coiled-coil domain-containing protein 66 isoform X2 [Boleophthalmus pectinirostris]